MIMIVVFDMFAKYIIILYLMLLFSNYGVFLIFTFKAQNPDLGRDSQTQKRFKIVFYFFHVLFALAFIAAFIPGLAPECSS